MSYKKCFKGSSQNTWPQLTTQLCIYVIISITSPSKYEVNMINIFFYLSSFSRRLVFSLSSLINIIILCASVFCSLAQQISYRKLGTHTMTFLPSTLADNIDVSGRWNWLKIYIVCEQEWNSYWQNNEYELWPYNVCTYILSQS